MRPYYVWLVLLLPTAWAASQLATSEPLMPPLSAGLLLLVVGGLAGLRIGADSVRHFVRELTALNKYLGEQNHDLVEMNHHLLRQIPLKRRKPQPSTEYEPAEEHR